MDKREGYVDVELMDILMEPKKYPSFYKEYVETGKYYNQINEYYDVFPKEQIKLLKYESFFSDLEKNIDELYTFLEINNNIKIELKNRMNTYKVTRFNIKKYYREYKIINFVGSLFPASFRRRVLQNFIYKDSDKLPFGKERDIMQEIFKEHNKKLFSKYDISY